MHPDVTFTRMMSWVGLFLATAICVGCSDGKLAVHPVSGKVLVDGKPAKDVMLIFVPQGGSPEFEKERPMATSGADGGFQLKTFDKNDGAPAGEYKIMARLMGPRGEVFGYKYFNPDTTPLAATIAEGPNDLPAIELSTKK